MKCIDNTGVLLYNINIEQLQKIYRKEKKCL